MTSHWAIDQLASTADKFHDGAQGAYRDGDLQRAEVNAELGRALDDASARVAAVINDKAEGN